MATTKRIAGRGDWLWLFACAALSSWWCVTAAGELSATFDEPLYLQRGLNSWRTGSHDGLLRLGTMPLPIDVQTLPLYAWERWHQVQLDAVADLNDLLPWARMGNLVFWWLLLYFGWRIGWSLGGAWGGRGAAALLAVEPNLVAHAALATTDIALTACLLGLLYTFRAGREKGWGLRVGWPALWFGAAVLAKASGMIFGPLCLVVVELERRLRQDNLDAAIQRRGPIVVLKQAARLLSQRAFWSDLVPIGAIGMALVVLYCGSDWQAEPSFVKWANGLSNGPLRQIMVPVAEKGRIFNNAGVALVKQIRHNLRGHGVFLLGEAHPRALWYYFPVLLTIKLSLLVLFLPVLVAGLRPAALTNWACLGAGVLLVFSLNCRVQIGIRLVFPLVALAIVGLAGGIGQLCQEATPFRRRWLVVGGGSGVAATGLTLLQLWPHGLCHVNPLWGGPSAGFRLVSDSNYDWGQGLTELRRWQEEQRLPPLDVWYFGASEVLPHYPFRHLPLHLPEGHAPQQIPQRLRGRLVAVSTSALYGHILRDNPWHRQAAEFLRDCTPVARTATFLIYDFRDAAEHSHAVRGQREPSAN
ncbi:MAG: glycosyltransferase family 39 protein [Gemmataceae bacterium]